MQGETIWHWIALEDCRSLAKLLVTPHAELNTRSHQVSVEPAVPCPECYMQHFMQLLQTA